MSKEAQLFIRGNCIEITELTDSNIFFHHRFESYYNYCKLFNYILSAEQPVNLELPNQCLWEIIDEFIYQFQAFSQFRSKLGKKTDEEIEILKSNPKVNLKAF